ncbi:MAG: 3-isopropylmalate dehydratase [Candidatus Heimdallarchaeota archaeon]|nr:3-isopropylmalate dehydratase [Candidatus Heimdallarchaeota archaeon]
MNKPTALTGKAIVIKDSQGNGIDDIDTDMIFHNKHLHITNIDEMGQFAFGNLPGWEKIGNINGNFLIVGKNFGSGSSRQQAVDCFTALGVVLIIAESVGAIYKRNAINAGMPLMIASDIMNELVETGDELEIDLTTGKIHNSSKNVPLSLAKPLSKVQLDIYQAGDLFAFGKSLD